MMLPLGVVNLEDFEGALELAALATPLPLFTGAELRLPPSWASGGGLVPCTGAEDLLPALAAGLPGAEALVVSLVPWLPPALWTPLLAGVPQLAPLVAGEA